MPQNQPKRATQVPGWLPWAILAAALAFFIWHASVSAFVQDDSYITYRYARNIVRGLGPVFNPGERVEGYTNFLWMMLIALLGKLGIAFTTIIPLTQVLGVIFGAVTIVLFFMLLRRHSTGPPLLAPLATLLLAACGSFAYWHVSGMETGLFTMLLAGAFWFYLAERTSRNRFIASVLLGLAALTRPEGALFAGLIALHAAAVNWSERKTSPFVRATLKDLAFLLVPLVVLVAPLYAWRLSYYGSLFPNTFYAKTGMSWSYIKSGLQYLWEFERAYGLFGLALVGPLLIAWRRKRLSLASPLVFAAFVLVAYSLYVVSVGGDVLRIYRFFVPVYVLAFFILTEGIWLLPLKPLLQAVLLLLLVPLTFYGPLARTRSVRSDVKMNLVLEDGLVDKMTASGRFLARELGPDDWFACTTIGAVSYYSDRNIIDMLGLTDSVVARHPENLLKGKMYWKERNYNTRHVLERNPKYIYFSTGVKPSASAERALFMRTRFRRGYYACPLSLPEPGDRIGSEVIYRAKPGADTLPIDPPYESSEFIELFVNGLNAIRKGKDSAIAALRKAVAVAPEDFGLAHEWLAGMFSDAKRTDSAFFYYQEAIRRDDYCVSSHSNLANIYYQRKDYPTAIAHLAKVIDYAPDYYDGLTNYATIAVAMKDYTAAESVLALTAERFPEISEVKLRQAYVKVEARKFDEAEQLLDEFLRLRPGDRNGLALLEYARRLKAQQP